MWAFLALATAVLTSLNPILYKRILQEAEPVAAVWGVMWLALPSLGVFTLALTPQMPALDGVFAFGVLGSAGLNVLAHLANTRALKLADVSLVSPLLVFSPVFSLLISAIVLGEVPSLQGALSVMLVLIGAYWLTHTAGAIWLAPLRAMAFTPGVLLVLGAGVLWAITPLLEKIAIQHTNPSNPRLVAFTVTLLLASSLSLAILPRAGSAIRKLALHRRELLLAGLIAGTAPVLGYTALSLGLVGYVTTLFKFSTLLTVVWGGLILRERGLSQRLPGATLMVVGAILMTVQDA